MPTSDSPPADPVAQLYRDHHGWLSVWLRRKLGNSFDAADLAHDTFVRLMAGRRRTDVGAEPRALLTHIAKGLVVDHWRRRALEEAVQIYPEMVLATPGGLVSEPATLNLLLAHCYTVWLRATPEEHMGRVMAQGDFRPMSGNNEAMADLKRILAGREAFYAKADLTWVTSNLDVQESFAGLRTQVRKACGLPL